MKEQEIIHKVCSDTVEECQCDHPEVSVVTEEYDWMEEGMQIAAQCWCDAETSDLIMDVPLAKAVARRIAFWMQTAAQNQRNADYYRGLVVECGEHIGSEAYIQDDGGICEDVLCAKVPELVGGRIKTDTVINRSTQPFQPSGKTAP